MSAGASTQAGKDVPVTADEVVQPLTDEEKAAYGRDLGTGAKSSDADAKADSDLAEQSHEVDTPRTYGDDESGAASAPVDEADSELAGADEKTVVKTTAPPKPGAPSGQAPSAKPGEGGNG